MNTSETLIFVHIPKTAGSTFSSILGGLYAGKIHSIYGVRELAGLAKIPEAERRQFSLLQGHFSYGIHELIPRPTRYITFLREPVERILSMYYYIWRTPGHYLHETIVSHNISLDRFINEGLTSEIKNFQVRAIAGLITATSNGLAEMNESTLTLAKQRLQSDFHAFGLTERFDESLILFTRALGWNLLSGKLCYQRKNVSHDRKRATEISPEIIDKIRQANHLDLQLYDYARQLFESRIKSSFGFRAQLFAFRQLQRHRLRREARNLELRGAS